MLTRCADAQLTMPQNAAHSHASRVSRRDLLRSAVATSCAALVPRGLEAADASPINEAMSGNYFPVHDPCIIRSGATYHLFSTGHAQEGSGLIPWRTSQDLVHWKLAGHVFDSIPAWARQAVPGTRGLWAPDIAFVDGQFRLYYSVSTFGSNRSVIGLATNRTLDPGSREFGWRDQGPVIESRRGDDFNAIDANFIADRDGGHWLTLGSFWSGIKLFPLDPASGKVRDGEARKYSLASRPVPERAPGAIEAPFLIERQGFYYLFVSFDYCCRGASSSYYIVVGRSANITGPYAGKDGKPMTDGFGTLLLQGNRRFRGPGHQAVLRDGERDYLVYHAYDAEHDGRSTLRISPITWSEDGWPAVEL